MLPGNPRRLRLARGRGSFGRRFNLELLQLWQSPAMSFAAPFVRSASDEGAKAGIAGLGLAAIAIALFALAAFSPAALGDGDTFSHLATGEWIIGHGAAPRADPFSLSTRAPLDRA
jgi:hypothetical protein